MKDDGSLNTSEGKSSKRGAAAAVHGAPEVYISYMHVFTIYSPWFDVKNLSLYACRNRFGFRSLLVHRILNSGKSLSFLSWLCTNFCAVTEYLNITKMQTIMTDCYHFSSNQTQAMPA